MKKHKWKVLIGIVIMAVFLYTVCNFLFSYHRLQENKSLIKQANTIEIKACFVNNLDKAISMKTLKEKKEIEEFAQRFELKLWSSPLEFPKPTSYVLILNIDNETDIIRIGTFNKKQLRLTDGGWMQSLKPSFQSYFVKIAESEGVVSEDVFEKLIEEWKAETSK